MSTVIEILQVKAAFIKILTITIFIPKEKKLTLYFLNLYIENTFIKISVII